MGKNGTCKAPAEGLIFCLGLARKAGEWQLALALLDIMLAKKLADKTLACN